MNTQLKLFDDQGTGFEECNVLGLKYLANYILIEEEFELLNNINCNHWSTELSRRVQHYGYKYDYKSRKINESMKVGKIPGWLEIYCDRLHKDNFFKEKPDQIIVNEYEPGQGIANHVDCEPCFTDTIVSLSLNSGCYMLFTKKDQPKIKKRVFLERRSIVSLKDDMRYKWLHGIEKRKNDIVEGLEIPRRKRISLTFRKVILTDSNSCEI